MTDEYQALAFETLGKPISYFQPRQHLPDSVTLDSPAIDVMTDLRQVTAVTARMTMPIHEALQRMRKRAVRLLLVTDLDDGTVYGLITARDIQGEKPVKLAQKLGYEPSQLVVRDLMTLKGRLEVLPYDAVLNAKVGNIVASLRDSGRQHALVVDADPDRDGVPAVRGIISLAHIGRQMGLDLDTAERATTYAELEAALGE
jgi:CBS domain containing-hemolysin-like protein